MLLSFIVFGIATVIVRGLNRAFPSLRESGFIGQFCLGYFTARAVAEVTIYVLTRVTERK